MKTSRKNPLNQTPPSVEDRNARLKAALQANMARRKAQAKARKAEDVPAPAPGTDAADGDGDGEA